MRFSAVMFCLPLILSGCSGGSGADPNLIPASGKVTIDGQPLLKGTITFFSKSGSHSSNSAIENGSFSLNSSASARGILPGEYLVSIISEEQEATFDDSGKVIPAKSAVPEKYVDAKTSGLTATVQKDQKNDFEFPLSTK